MALLSLNFRAQAQGRQMILVLFSHQLPGILARQMVNFSVCVLSVPTEQWKILYSGHVGSHFRHKTLYSFRGKLLNWLNYFLFNLLSKDLQLGKKIFQDYTERKCMSDCIFFGGSFAKLLYFFFIGFDRKKACRDQILCAGADTIENLI